jgi:pilus assembly protein Flp/PilA
MPGDVGCPGTITACLAVRFPPPRSYSLTPRVLRNPHHRVTRESAIRQFTKKVVKFLKAEDGPTAVEYAVMLALIIVACIVAVTALGQNANTTFQTVKNALPSGS